MRDTLEEIKTLSLEDKIDILLALLTAQGENVGDNDTIFHLSRQVGNYLKDKSGYGMSDIGLPKPKNYKEALVSDMLYAAEGIRAVLVAQNLEQDVDFSIQVRFEHQGDSSHLNSISLWHHFDEMFPKNFNGETRSYSYFYPNYDAQNCIIMTNLNTKEQVSVLNDDIQSRIDRNIEYYEKDYLNKYIIRKINKIF